MTGNPEEEGLVVPENIAGPFLGERRLSGWSFRHDGGAQSASVVFYEGGGCTVFTVNGTHHVRERRMFARPLSVCQVACGRHITSFEVQLPAAGAATFFLTKVTLRWQVTDYERVVVNRLSSVERDLGEEIVHRLREVSERFSVRDAQEANQAIRADIRAGRWRNLGSDVGLTAELFVGVGTDEVILSQVAEARTDEGEEQRVARRFAAYSRLAGGSASDRLAYLMASGTKDDVNDVIKMMREDDSQGRSDTRDFFIRMLEQDRITSPELEAHLRSLILTGQSADPQYQALAERALPPASPPPRLSLPAAPSGHGAGSAAASGTRDAAGGSEQDWPGTGSGSGRGQAREGRVWNDGSWVDEYEGGLAAGGAGARRASGSDSAPESSGRGQGRSRPPRDLWADEDSPGDEPGRGGSSAGGQSRHGRSGDGRSGDDRVGAGGRSGPGRDAGEREWDDQEREDRSPPDWPGEGRHYRDREERATSNRFDHGAPRRAQAQNERGGDSWSRDERDGASWTNGDPARSDSVRREATDGGGEWDRPPSGRSYQDGLRDERGGDERSRGHRPRADRSRTDPPDGDRRWDDRSGNGRSGAERPRADRPSTDRPRTESGWDDRPHGGRSRDDRGRDNWSRDDRGRDDRGRDYPSGGDRSHDDGDRDERYRSARADRYRDAEPRDADPRQSGGRQSDPRRSEGRQGRGSDYWSVSDGEEGRG
ncbi:hypothetical protein [Streptomyces albipurpureus]|uniref:PE-PGRS family protein n=1 Tax=Streptomyces albipurpureus TaxID=2897419 RepID=A0ABT0UN58_9ACTN|nr:hypothetical protein [Streptomyces sp. CWNU-1]MCM2388838.1 hypothetical protein [Streptomyces sp. CWNU-1]